MVNRPRPSPTRVQNSRNVGPIVDPGPEPAVITQPFDPTRINIITKQMSLDTLIKRISNGEIVLCPDFQRNEVWNLRTRSRLIESLLIRIPLPAFYMDATDEEKWLVVDGLQRLSTLRDFVIEKDETKRLKLHDLEFLDLENCDYRKLPRNYQRRIDETQVTVYLIEKGTPDKVKFNVFKRINTGGMPLSAQEIRHALNQGPATAMLKTLAESKEFLVATGKGIGALRMKDRESVLRCLAFMIFPLKDYTRRDFDEFLTEAMERLNKMTAPERSDLGQRFRRVMTAAHDLFEGKAFRKPESAGTRSGRSPINKALLETWSSQLAELSDAQISRLGERKSSLNRGFSRLLEKDTKFVGAISQGTAKPEKVRYRFRAIEKLIGGILK